MKIHRNELLRAQAKRLTRHIILTAAVLAVLTPTLASAQSDKVVTAYGKCLVAKVKLGPYTSADGGRSAILLQAQCDDWKAYVEQCIASSVDTVECRMRAAFLVQSVIILRENGFKD